MARKSARVDALASLALLLAASAAGGERWAPKAAVGRPAPAFALPDQDGRRVALKDLAGSFVVLEWFDHECATTRKHYGPGAMQALQRRYAAKGVRWFAVASNAPGEMGHLTAKKARAVRAAEKMQPPILLDPSGRVGRLYGARTTPQFFVIGPKGALLYSGPTDDCYAASLEQCPERRVHVAEALDEAMAGEPVSRPLVAPFGCAVKYE